MSVQITTLNENTANSGFVAEWGLSILIEADGLRLLLDTGPGFSTVYNAQLLGIDFATVDRIALSHGHFDHTGGLFEVLRRSREIDIVAHPEVWGSKYAVRGGAERYIGIPFTQEQLENLGAHFSLTREPLWITDTMVTSGEIPIVTDYEEIDSNLFVKKGEDLVPDTVPDDLALAVKTELGLAIILGCAHRGMINTTKHFQEITGEERVYSVIGGTHLISASPERMALTAAALREIGIKRLGVSHCTGLAASAWLAGEFTEEFFANNAGSRFTLP